MLIDEKEDSINDGFFEYGRIRTPSLTARRVITAARVIKLADGRSEVHKWLDEPVLRPVSKAKVYLSGSTAPRDMLWLRERTTARQ